MEIPVTEARKVLADLINRVVYGGEEVVLTRHGKTVAALVSPEELEVLRMLRAGRLDLTQTGPAPSDQPAADTPRHEPPLRIAAHLRPPGPPPSSRPPGFGR
ncbi:type II toxin-antitoxin system Phd/YefM family antitoxin [Actinomadura rupiterrae]|uniref:type II toxin-antitoxin system Phd/YefM family antitoxin n=1 Tax=Actinomadura rupiterrae TaxID=559627 RepID=UPI0027E36482|nr:type II toxin-antitoxin system Phd/YefM family antitoxin [Actinomadura rupiterrae]MCP2342646.1 prevent-host-death family protein [Actinomadura rupiterrae]